MGKDKKCYSTKAKAKMASRKGERVVHYEKNCYQLVRVRR